MKHSFFFYFSIIVAIIAVSPYLCFAFKSTSYTVTATVDEYLTFLDFNGKISTETNCKYPALIIRLPDGKKAVTVNF